MRLAFFLLFVFHSNHQSELYVIKSVSEYTTSVIDADYKKMEDVSKIKGLKISLKYNTDDNFMHQKLYEHAKTTYLRRDAFYALELVQKELSKKRLGLLIWDAYRPFSVTQLMWDKIHDEKYVANPKNGSGHNKGIAVDLTIIDSNGNLLSMGTGFDNFTDTAHAEFKNLNEDVLKNRMLLRSTMEHFGFKVLSTEWWHFYFDDNKNYDVLDLSFPDLKKANRWLHHFDSK